MIPPTACIVPLFMRIFPLFLFLPGPIATPDSPPVAFTLPPFIVIVPASSFSQPPMPAAPYPPPVAVIVPPLIVIIPVPEPLVPPIPAIAVSKTAVE